MHSTPPTDAELLADWLQHQRERAFHELVARYSGLVHSAAKRTCGDEVMAGEASQLVFIQLARKAGSLATRSSLAGWLYLTAVMQTKNLMRGNLREDRKRHQLHTEMEIQQTQTEAGWQEMKPVLDDALAALSEKDREALLLHYYRAMSVREIAGALGIAMEAARKRIDRATERLRAKLSIRGCQTGGSFGMVLMAGFAADTKVPAMLSQAFSTKALAAAGGAPASASLLATLATMKATPFIPPAAALLAAGLLLSSQHDEIAAMERRKDLLHERITDAAAARSATAAAGGARRSPAQTDGRKGKASMDWREAAALVSSLNKGSTGFAEMRDLSRLRQHLSSMTGDEIIAAMAEVDAMTDLSGETRTMLGSMFVETLCKVDPELALRRAGESLGDTRSGRSHFLSGALANWVRKDLAAATAWFDAELAKGSFESRALNGSNYVRPQFEANLISVLIGTDPEACERRIAALPKEQRVQVFSGFTYLHLEEKDYEAYARIARVSSAAGMDPAQTVARPAVKLVEQGSYGKVDRYLDAISATPDERAGTVAQVANAKLGMIASGNKVGVKDIDGVLKWASSQNAGAADAAVGSALGGISNSKSSYSELGALALHYQESSGSDAMLAGFLEGGNARQNLEIARGLAEKINDPARRAKILDSLK